MSDPDMGMVFIAGSVHLREIKKNFLQMRFADLFVPVSRAVRIDPYEVAALKFSNVRSESAVGQAQGMGQIIHAHTSVLDQKIQNLDPHFGSERGKHSQLFFWVLNVSHGSGSFSHMDLCVMVQWSLRFHFMPYSIMFI